MSTGEIRRAQLVTPFGVGAMSVLVDGSSIITAGLDHWFDHDEKHNLREVDYIVNDFRLRRHLNVDQLRLPPDYRIPRPGDKQPNVGLTIPALRFPLWCFCHQCRRLDQTKLFTSSALPCTNSAHKNGASRMSQVPFVTVCEQGHLGDFPFREWAHSQANPTCQGRLRLRSSGGGSLAKQSISCESCGKKRSLRSITETRNHPDDAATETTFLTLELQKGEEYLCRGPMPWLGVAGNGCGHPIRAALRGAGNVYYPKVSSSIYLPQSQHGAEPALLEALDHYRVRPILKMYEGLKDPFDLATLRKPFIADLFTDYTNDQLQAGLDEYFGATQTSAPTEAPAPDSTEREYTMTDGWRHPEFLQIRETPTDEDLAGRDPGVPPGLESFFGRVRQIETLRETRVLRGFTRVKDAPLNLDPPAVIRGGC